jgi:hypothetical protein
MRKSLKKSHKARKRNAHVNKSRRRNKKRITVRRNIRGGGPKKLTIGKTLRSHSASRGDVVGSYDSRFEGTNPMPSATPTRRRTASARKLLTASAASAASTPHEMRAASARPRPDVPHMEPLPNKNIDEDREPFIDDPSYSDGPDRSYISEYGDLQYKFKSADNRSAYPDAYRDFLKLQKNMLKRQGEVRSERGPFVASQFPSSEQTTISPLELDHRLKLVVVKREGSDDYIVLMTHAYMENYNYVGEYILKWTDTDGGNITIRTHAKDVKTINPDTLHKIIQHANEKFGSRHNLDSFNELKSLDQTEYYDIIRDYFGISEEVPAKDILFLRTYNEISHSAIPYMFREPIQKDAHDMPLVFIGAEGVFYENSSRKLCFIIVNRSGHYKTPKQRMDNLKLILQREYGYQDSDIKLFDAHGHYQYMTNDNEIHGFEDAEDYLDDLEKVSTFTVEPSPELIAPRYSPDEYSEP